MEDLLQFNTKIRTSTDTELIEKDGRWVVATSLVLLSQRGKRLAYELTPNKKGKKNKLSVELLRPYM